MKGLGGFHLIADARNDAAVSRLRARKHREEKPFAVMFPTLAAIEAACDLRHEEVALLDGAASDRSFSSRRKAPPSSDRRKQRAARDRRVSSRPEIRGIGAMLPYTPLHHLLLAELGFPVVATSGNRSEEPIVIDEAEAVARLGGIADLFLVHDRPIVRPVDDLVARIVAGRPLLLRRARGYAPAPPVEHDLPPGILALGGHLKATVALTLGKGAVLSQHIGDLETAEARDAYDRVRADLTRLHARRAADRRPRSSSGLPLQPCRGGIGPADRRGAAPSRPRRRLHGGASAEAAGARRFLRRDRLRRGRHDLGRRVPARQRNRVAARRPPSAVPASGRRGGGARAAPVGTRACCSSCSGRPVST